MHSNKCCAIKGQSIQTGLVGGVSALGGVSGTVFPDVGQVICGLLGELVFVGVIDQSERAVKGLVLVNGYVLILYVRGISVLEAADQTLYDLNCKNGREHDQKQSDDDADEDDDHLLLLLTVIALDVTGGVAARGSVVIHGKLLSSICIWGMNYFASLMEKSIRPFLSRPMYFTLTAEPTSIPASVTLLILLSQILEM